MLERFCDPALMESSFRRGAREGMRDFLPLSVGLLPWAMVTGIAMRSIGLSEIEAMGMNLLVYAGTAQLGTLPLIGSGAPLWLIFLTALVLNLRFVIFSAALAPVFHDHRFMRRLASSYLLVDGMFAVGADKLQRPTIRTGAGATTSRPRRINWLLWQLCGIARHVRRRGDSARLVAGVHDHDRADGDDDADGARAADAGGRAGGRAGRGAAARAAAAPGADGRHRARHRRRLRRRARAGREGGARSKR
jgi:hypothetical protein